MASRSKTRKAFVSAGISPIVRKLHGLDGVLPAFASQASCMSVHSIGTVGHDPHNAPRAIKLSSSATR